MQNIAEKIEQTFGKILEENKDKIYRICSVYSVSPLESKDLFQEVAYEIWKSLSTFKGKSNINTWIYRITLNVCLRSKQNSEKNVENLVRLESIQFIPSENIPDKSQQEKYQAVHDCISLLNERNQSIIILYLEDLPYKEIAVITGLSENHIAVKMKRIRKLLNCITDKL